MEQLALVAELVERLWSLQLFSFAAPQQHYLSLQLLALLLAWEQAPLQELLQWA